MPHDPLVYAIFIIFTGAAVAATLALFARQSLLVSYILLGVVMGPWGLGLVEDASLIKEISHVGVVFLLFLLGLNLHPQKLIKLFRETFMVTLISSVIFFAVGLGGGLLFGFTPLDSLVVGLAAMFSSTILGLKLLPTTELHHRRTGELIISVLLFQDLIAILILLFLKSNAGNGNLFESMGVLLVALPLLFAGALLMARFVLVPLFIRFDTIQEYLFLVAIGWSLGVAQIAALIGVSQEIGAFIAGIAIASSPISTFIAESLKPLRDFFLVMFFFSLGALFDLSMLGSLLIPVLVLGSVMVLIKPVVFGRLFRMAGERPVLAIELGIRLGQVSEFSMFIAIVALESQLISEQASYLIQLLTLFSFIVSSYWIMLRYPTPIAISHALRRD